MREPQVPHPYFEEGGRPRQKLQTAESPAESNGICAFLIASKTWTFCSICLKFGRCDALEGSRVPEYFMPFGWETALVTEYWQALPLKLSVGKNENELDLIPN